MIVPFGKYRGRSVEHVMVVDHSYSVWAYANVDVYRMYVRVNYPKYALVYSTELGLIDYERKMWAEFGDCREKSMLGWMNEAARKLDVGSVSALKLEISAVRRIYRGI